MDAIDLLNDDVADLPRERTNDDFVTSLKSIFDPFLAKVNNLNALDCVSQAIRAEELNIKNLCDSIIKAVTSALNGLPHEAYNNLADGISTVQAHFNQLHTPQSVAAISPLKQLYRVRVAGPEGAGFTRPDLFHIPFEKRHLVTRQRYSLPGLPCLYLGGTLYMCWQELGRPNFDSIYYARFKTVEDASIKFLDFAYRPAMIAATIDRYKSSMAQSSPWVPFAIAQAVCWPLLAACSVKKMHADVPFVHEYIIPQLVLQWIISQNEVDGIRYFSVNENSYVDNPVMLCNYVFPARKMAASGHCRILRSKFELSEPMSWQIMAGLSQTLPRSTALHGGTRLNLAPAIQLEYWQTPFGVIESMSLHQPCSKI